MLALARVVADNEMRHRPQTMPQAALGAALRQGGFTGANHPDWKPGQPDQAAGFLYAATRRRPTTALSANSLSWKLATVVNTSLEKLQRHSQAEGETSLAGLPWTQAIHPGASKGA